MAAPVAPLQALLLGRCGKHVMMRCGRSCCGELSTVVLWWLRTSLKSTSCGTSWPAFQVDTKMRPFCLLGAGKHPAVTVD